jgi:hypothetical protein
LIDIREGRRRRDRQCLRMKGNIDGEEFIILKGTIDVCADAGLPSLEVYVDGKALGGVEVHDRTWEVTPKAISPWLGRHVQELTPPTRQSMVVVLAPGINGGATGDLAFVGIHYYYPNPPPRNQLVIQYAVSFISRLSPALY